VLHLLSTPEKLLSAILLGNTVVNITASAIATSIAADYFPESGGFSLALAVGVMTFLLLVFGEISPKTLAVARAEKWASRSSRVLTFLLGAVSPIASALSRFSGAVASRIGLHRSGASLSREEIIALVELGRSEGLLGSEGGATLNLLTLNESQCTDVMKPRSEVAVLRTGWTRDRFQQVIRSSGFTRFPVLQGPMEKVAGYVDSREFFVQREGSPLPLHPLPSFPENAQLEVVLKGLRDMDEEIGAVFDEYGDWTGIITVHDILDFFLFSSSLRPGTLPPGVSVRDGWLEIPAAMKLSTLSELAGREFTARFAETCGGLVQEITGRIPEEGEEMEISGYLFRVISKEGPRLDRMKVRLRGERKGAK
jgi:putative hemolysin